jgi:hypothetical protein
MYNYYSYINNKNLQIKTDKIQKEEDHHKQKRKHNIEKLVTGYENRLKHFIYNMASEPILIKDSSVNIQTTRKQLLDEQVDKIRDGHGFVLKGFKTEKQRIEDYLDEKNYGYIDKREKEFIKFLNSKNNDKSVKSPKKQKESIIVQPSMRFKARSDLERIYDTNNDYNLGRVDRKIIDKHLDAMGLYASRRVKTEVSEDMNDYILYSQMDFVEKEKQAEAEKVKKRRDEIRKRRNDAISFRENRYRIEQVPHKQLIMDSKNIMGDLHHKTFFKGAADFTISYENKPVNKKHNLAQSIPENVEYVYRNINDDYNYNEILPNLSPIVNLLNMNPYIKKENQEILDEEKLKILKELAFRKDELKKETRASKVSFVGNQELASNHVGESFLTEHPLLKNFSENIEIRRPDDEKIVIGNVELNRDDIAGISRLVLANCNYFHKKNKNNNSSLKSLSGKLMQTNGMSIMDFMSKYNITNTASNKK